MLSLYKYPIGRGGQAWVTSTWTGSRESPDSSEGLREQTWDLRVQAQLSCIGVKASRLNMQSLRKH